MPPSGSTPAEAQFRTLAGMVPPVREVHVVPGEASEPPHGITTEMELSSLYRD